MSNPNPSPETRIRPGECRNPRGLKGPRLKAILERQADEFLLTTKGTQVTRAEAICTVAWKLALGGDLRAVEWLADRLDGKVTDRLRVSGDSTGMLITVRHVDGLSDRSRIGGSELALGPEGDRGGDETL